jgi:hypothetical protein
VNQFEKTRSADLVEVTGVIRRETDAAILFDDGTEQVWIPKSQIDTTEELGGGLAEITIPEWLAIKKGLV